MTGNHRNLALSTRQVLNPMRVLGILRLDTRTLFALDKLENASEEMKISNVDILEVNATRWSDNDFCQ